MKRDIRSGTENLLDQGIFSPKRVKVRITTFVDEDVLEKLKEYAKERGMKYQTALNSILRYFFDKLLSKEKVEGLTEDRVRRIVQEELRKRA